MKKSKILGFLLGLIVPGLGHIYAREYRKAGIIFAIYIVLVVFFYSCCMYTILYLPAKAIYSAISILGLFLIYLIYSAISAWIAISKFNTKDKKLIKKKYSYVLGAIYIISYFLMPVITILLYREFIGRAYKIIGHAMDPSLVHRDRVGVKKISRAIKNLKQGDIIVYKPPLYPKRIFVHRIIALPSEVVTISGGRVRINDWTPDNDTVRNNYYMNMGEYGESGKKYKVPDDMVYVLGDCSIDSLDSRIMGYIPFKNIEGKVVSIWWPKKRIKKLKNN